MAKATPVRLNIAEIVSHMLCVAMHAGIKKVKEYFQPARRNNSKCAAYSQLISDAKQFNLFQNRLFSREEEKAFMARRTHGSYLWAEIPEKMHTMEQKYFCGSWGTWSMHIGFDEIPILAAPHIPPANK